MSVWFDPCRLLFHRTHIYICMSVIHLLYTQTKPFRLSHYAGTACNIQEERMEKDV